MSFGQTSPIPSAPPAPPFSRPRASVQSIVRQSQGPTASNGRSPQARTVSSCQLGEHQPGCGHKAVKHGDHVGYLNDDGQLDCKIGDDIVTHDLPKQKKKQVRRMYDMFDNYDLADRDVEERRPWYKDRDSARFIGMFVLTGVYCVAEMFYGLKIGSLGLIADAMHMLSDFIALIVGYYAMRSAKLNSSYSKTFGLKRMETVASLMNATFMLAICLNMFMEAFDKFMTGYEADNKLVQNVDTMLTVNYIGLAINFLGMVVFGRDGHGHSHGGGSAPDAHQHSHSENSHSENSHSENSVVVDDDSSCWSRMGPKDVNIRGILIHFIGDVLGSAAVACSGLAIKYGQGNWRFYMDPMSAVFISIIIVIGTWPLVKQTSKVLQQETPSSIDLKELTKRLLKIEGIDEVHDLHVWTLTGSKIVASMHILVRDASNFMRISDKIKVELHQEGIHSSTIQPEVVERDQLSKVLAREISCHEPICSRSLCTVNMCCSQRKEMIARISDEHRIQQ